MNDDERESIRRDVLASMEGVGRLNLAFIGVTNGLFEAMAALGQATAEELARQAERDVGYVVRWCDAAFAFGLLGEVVPEPASRPRDSAVGWRSVRAICTTSRSTSPSTSSR